MIVIATAGWSIPRTSADAMPRRGTHLERYARRFSGVEINTSFYREHSAEVYARWAAGTPREFRFAVKLPGEITHELKLRRARKPLQRFLSQARGLGDKLGPLLVQLPPSLQFERPVVRRFAQLLHTLHGGPVAWEPRHPSWFLAGADDLLERFGMTRAAADPAVVPEAALPGGSSRLVYLRWHGSPRKYWSVYEPAQIEELADRCRLSPQGAQTWCVFDNTASGGALHNALQLRAALTRRRSRR